MANKQQTAVEWAFEQISNIDWKYLSDSDRNDLFNQALKIEREQKINAYNEGVESEYEYHINSAPRITAEQYYNQTYSLPDEKPE
jgi:hypothetical protein